MDLIERKALIRSIMYDLWDFETVDGIKASTVIKQTLSDINNEPAIDAVPVVRCKDCKWWVDEDGTIDLPGGKKSARCNMHNHFVHGRHYGWCPKEDDFCSIGEKK